jgi:hypothetical protein
VTSPSIIAMGVRLRPLESVPVVGELLGLRRGAAFRAAAAWPTTGEPRSRKVIVSTLMAQLGIPVQWEAGEPDPVTRPASRLRGPCEGCDEGACGTCVHAPIEPGEPGRG